MEYTFKIIIEECEEGGYYAECPSFQGCHVEGDTYEETIEEMKQAIAVFIESYQKNEKIIPIDNYSIASVRVPV
ncbi:MAG: type II toxin-antitoxin system HicB family antitoxin [Spirochaetes bacterium]|nr:type II toxin-antitoxin system HicB family antitoxin [Spirochaetota bacterium]